MILKFSATVLTSITILCGNLSNASATIQPVQTRTTFEFHPDRAHAAVAVHPALAPKSDGKPRLYHVRDDQTPQNRQSAPAQPSKRTDEKKSLADHSQQQLASKDNEIASLREKILIVNELLNVEKRHIESLEAQLIQKERELNALHDQGDAQGKAFKDSEKLRSDSQHAKHKTDDFERQLLSNNLENAKQRIGELILQLYAKENELATLRSSAHEDSKQLHTDLDSLTVDLHQAKGRITELEQQAAGGAAQELAQAKRRIAELEQRATGREQELALAKRRAIELEQQPTGGTTHDLAQAKRRITELEQQTWMKEHDLAIAKRRVTELEQQATGGKPQELAQAKRRITELEQQTAGKEQELTQTRQRTTELEQQIAGKDQDLAQTKRRVTEVEQQTTGKEQELVQAKRRIAELEQQTVGKEQDLAHAKRRAAEVEQQMAGGKPQDLAQAKRRITELQQQSWLKEYDLAQAKRRVTELEQQAAKSTSQELAQAKRRITELEHQTVGKEHELGQATRRLTELEQLTAGKEQELAQVKRRMTEVEQQMAGAKAQDLAQAKRRITELEQQTVGKEQELTQAKRRVVELEQQATGGTAQDLAQTKRRMAELEQQTAGKERELAKLKDELLQVTRKFDVLNPQLIARTTELEQTKQILADLQRNAFPLADPGPVQESTSSETEVVNQQLVETDLPLPNLARSSSASAVEDIGHGTLSKETESLARLLQAELAKGSVAMRRRGNKLTLAFAAGELFAPGEAVMTPGGTSLLGQVGVALSDFQAQSIQVAVLPNTTPTSNTPRKNGRDNTDLLQTRAERATQALINGGVEIDRITAVGQSIIKPDVTEDAANDPRKNQKVEIMIVSEPPPATRSKTAASQFSKKPPRSTEKIVNR